MKIRAELLAAIGDHAGVREALGDFLTRELEDCRLEMEAADDNITMWRAQGRAREARRLLSALKKTGG